jgi:chloride channel protein, CIC family
MGIKTLYQAVFNFLRTKLSRVQFVMVIATLVGFFSGLVAVLLKSKVHRLQHWVQDVSFHRYAYLLFPAIGPIITVFVNRGFFSPSILRKSLSAPS